MHASTDPIILAREAAASLYPEENFVKRGDQLVGYPNVVRAAILAGRFDGGEIVKQHLPKDPA